MKDRDLASATEIAIQPGRSGISSIRLTRRRSGKRISMPASRGSSSAGCRAATRHAFHHRGAFAAGERKNPRRPGLAKRLPTISNTGPRSACTSCMNCSYQRSLAIGFAVLIACLVGSQIVVAIFANQIIARVLEESLIIVGWVANKVPIEIYLYDWLPIRRRIGLFRRLAAAPLQIRSCSYRLSLISEL